MKKYQKILAIFVMVIGLFFTAKVSALQITAGELPDIPGNPEKYVIIEDNNYIYALVIPDNQQVYVDSNEEFIFVDSTNTYSTTLGGDSWTDAGSDFSKNYEEILATTVPIYNNDKTEVLYNSGYGFPVQTIFDGALGVITEILTFLVTVTSALLSNTIFQLVIGISVLFIIIGLVYGLTKKFRKRGR